MRNSLERHEKVFKIKENVKIVMRKSGESLLHYTCRRAFSCLFSPNFSELIYPRKKTGVTMNTTLHFRQEAMGIIITDYFPKKAVTLSGADENIDNS